MPPADNAPPALSDAQLTAVFTHFVDAGWYRNRYADVAAADLDPVQHFIRFGAREGRDPNPFFDSAWYLRHYPDVAASGVNPLLHYLQAGAAELRNPHPRFDAAYYANEYPEAAANPLLFHIRIGKARGYATEKPLDVTAFQPSPRRLRPAPRGVKVDVIIPVYRGLDETRLCLDSILADPAPSRGRIIVVEDRSPEPDLVAWLQDLAAAGRITLLRNPCNLGFVASVNRGMLEAGRNDVILLNSDTEVPAGWVGRLAAQAYAAPRIASVSPFSNNATICGYPDDQGGPLALDHTLAEIDDACRTVNAGRYVDVPTTVGFCMYIRRDALDQVGMFDAERFGHGYGEENDFCLRATEAGWKHRLACDTFVYHKGQVSFGDRRNALAAKATNLLLERFPDYEWRVARHVARGETTPWRFTVTAELFRASGLPVILMVTHGLGGGVRRHIERLVEQCLGKAHVLLLESTERGLALSVPSLPNHPSQPLPAGRDEDLAVILQAMHVSRVHVHHLMGIDADLGGIVRRLGVPFDTTVHDYYGICPQINLLPTRHGLYCGEPDIGACNACIARSHHWARDILTWRAEHAWAFRDAARVICPSRDALDRLKRYYPDANLVLAPHESVGAEPWPMRPVNPGRGRLRIAIIGTLAEHKGSHGVAALAALIDTKRFDLHLIGAIDGAFPDDVRARIRATGRYADADLPTLIETVAPHVIWFPMTWPETFSYTLSAAIASGIPIAAPQLGAFPERLAGRPFTWLVPAATRPAAWLDLFETIRAALRRPHAGPVPLRTAQPDFYARDYLARPRRPAVIRRRARPRLAIVPERYDNGFPTPCAYIRLLQPLTHPAIADDLDVVVHDCETILAEDADIIVTQRFAPPDHEAADRLIAHARNLGATLVYDLDDDLLNIPRSHPDAAMLRPQARTARQMLLAADIAWVSTTALAAAIADLRSDAAVIGNRLDERIWAAEPRPAPHWNGPVRILAMGTTSHTPDFALIEPALLRLKAEYGDRVSIDVLGMTNQPELPPGLNRIGPSSHAARSYAGFVQWLTAQRPGWHIGLAPLLDTKFNRCKSPLKAMDYAAAGMVVLASDTPVYRGSLADGPAGQLVANTPDAWHAALDWLVRNRDLRQDLAHRARAAVAASATLASHPDEWRNALVQALPLRRTGSAA